MTNLGPYYRAPPSAAWVRVASSVLKKNKKIKKKKGREGWVKNYRVVET